MLFIFSYLSFSSLQHLELFLHKISSNMFTFSIKYLTFFLKAEPFLLLLGTESILQKFLTNFSVCDITSGILFVVKIK